MHVNPIDAGRLSSRWSAVGNGHRQPVARQDFDPTLVEVVSCSRPSPPEVRPNGEVIVDALVHNPNSEAVSFEVTWGATDIDGQPSVARETGQVGPGSTASVKTSFVPANVNILPAPPYATNVRATIVPGSIGGVFAPFEEGLNATGGCSTCGHAPIRAHSTDCGGLTVLTEGGEPPESDLGINLGVLAIGGGAVLLAKRRGVF